MRISKVVIKSFKRFHNLTIQNIPETARLVVLTGPNGCDIKSASGEIYNATKKLLNLTNAGNTTDAFCRDTLAPLVNRRTLVYKKLKRDIFGF